MQGESNLTCDGLWPTTGRDGVIATGDKRAAALIAAVLGYGELPRGDAALILRMSDVTARKIMGAHLRAGFLKSASPKTPVRLTFPLD